MGATRVCSRCAQECTTWFALQGSAFTGYGNTGDNVYCTVECANSDIMSFWEPTAVENIAAGPFGYCSVEYQERHRRSHEVYCYDTEPIRVFNYTPRIMKYFAVTSVVYG
eukprot:g829.t1